MRLVLHPIRVPRRDNFVAGAASVKIRFPGPYSFSLPEAKRQSHSFVVLPFTSERLHTEIDFNHETFRLAVDGFREDDQLDVRLEDERRLSAWVTHSAFPPPHCHAQCEDSGEVGFPCVKCTKGELVVTLCC